MAWNRPTLQENIDRFEQAMVGGLEVSSPVLRRSVVRMLSRAVGGMSHMVLGFIAYLVRQVHPDKSDEEHLTRQAALHYVFRNEATYADGEVTVTGTNGTVIPSGTRFFREDGIGYKTLASGTISAGSVVVTVESLTAGVSGNLLAGEEMQFEAPIPGADPTVEVTAEISGGTDREELEAFRLRFVEVLRNESLGGSDADYIKWAKTVAGVTRVWVYRHEDGRGTVKVRFVRDGDVSIIPSAGEVSDVQDALDAERPTTAEVTAAAPVLAPIAFTIELNPNTAANRALVTAELQDLFFRRAAPGSTTDPELGKILLSEMRTAVGVVVPDYIMTVPSADYSPAVGQFASLGTITWI